MPPVSRRSTPIICVTGSEEPVVRHVHNRGGIPKEVLPRMFEPFRSRRQYTRRGVLGLGLFITRAIARAHGGSLEAQSTGDATTFELVLPRYTASSVCSDRRASTRESRYVIVRD
jgi:C4-dicarboxylate-specific signal transduction histidine kinase